MFSRPREASERVSQEKLWGVIQEYYVNGRLLLAVTSMYSCSGVCVRAHELNDSSSPGALNSTNVCIDTTSLHNAGLHELDSHSKVDEGITVVSRRINLLLFATNLILLEYSKQDLQYAFDRFGAACDHAGMKITTYKRPRNCVSQVSTNQRCLLQVSGNALQLVEKFKQVEGVLTSDRGRKRRLIQGLIKQTLLCFRFIARC